MDYFRPLARDGWVKGQAMFECVEILFNRCHRRGRVEASRLWQNVALQLLANVEGLWTWKDKEHARYAASCGPDKFWIMSHSKILEQMLRDLIQETENWDLATQPASLWWTSTHDPEEKSDLSIDTKSGRPGFPCEEKFKILGCAMNRQGKAREDIQERMQSANKAWWKV